MPQAINHILSVVKLIWIVMSGIVLVVTLWFFDQKPNSDVDVILVWAMLILSFPSSWLVILGNSALAYLLWTYWGIVLESSYFSLTVTWLAMFAVGYFQWFYVVPYLIGRWKKKLS